ncbi:UNVERIFIED_ORG: hypothetical protein MaF1660_ph0005 [Mycobacterium phage Adler]
MFQRPRCQRLSHPRAEIPPRRCRTARGMGRTSARYENPQLSRRELSPARPGVFNDSPRSACREDQSLSQSAG